ncbi:response regulator [Bradyrhizobium guangdongense]|nr:response regulator [Bradyrhizobium guangdongense]GGI34329.1 hypothetical protein GCM10010987_78850 [Bradyrhizobium guangdongense]
MYFPRYTGSEPQPGSSDDGELLSEGSSVETILVVEDDPDLRSHISDVLRDLNYRVLSAGGAQSALTVLLQDNQAVDLLLTDVVMPGINGRELGRRAQEIRPHLRILYMTGYSRNAVVHQGRLDEGVDLLEKPVTQAKLALKVREILDRAHDSPGVRSGCFEAGIGLLRSLQTAWERLPRSLKGHKGKSLLHKKDPRLRGPLLEQSTAAQLLH